MIEIYNNILCIEAGWLTNNVMSESNYKALKNRGHISQLRIGGNGRTALIEYESLPDRFKKIIVSKIGDPKSRVKHSQFKMRLQPDMKAIEFFANYKLQIGRNLPTERAKEYHTNAMFLNAIIDMSQNAKARRRAFGGSIKGIWASISEVVNELHEEYQHSLPTNAIRLKDRANRYRREGYTSLIHRNYGNQNSRKVDEQLENLILSIYVMKNKPYTNMVLDIYLEFLSGKIDIIDIHTGEIFQRTDFWDENKGSYIIVSEVTVWNYINDPKNRAIVDSKRNDGHYFNNLHRPHHHRHLPNYSLSKISLDDRDLVRVMKDSSGHTIRAKAYYAYDVASGALIGFAHSKSKDADLFLSCIRNIFYFLNKNSIGIPMEVEVEHHLVNQYKDDLMKAGVLFPFVRFCNPGNSQEKRAEHFIKAKKYGFEKRYQDGIGRYTLSEANRPAQDKEWNADGMEVKEKFYTYDQLLADDIYTIEKYNNSLHPDQKKHKGMTRMDVLLMKLNPNLPQFNEELIARWIGEKTKTTIRRNQYVRVQYEKYQLPNLEILTKLESNNYNVIAYYLPALNGEISKVHLYQGLEFIGTCEKIISYNESKAEQTDEDIESYTNQSKYVSQFDSKIREGSNKLAGIKIINNENYKDPEIVEIHQPSSIIDSWEFNTDFESNAVDEL